RQRVRAEGQILNPHNFVGDRSSALPRMEHAMQTIMRTTLLILALVPWGTESALAQAYPPPAGSPPRASAPPSQSGQYSSNEVLDAGHRFFGTISRGLGEIVEKA